MIGTIRKHSTWLWAIVITATIISFVYWGSYTSPTGGPGDRIGDLGTIYGERVTSDEFFKTYRETELRYFLTMGEWPSAGSDSNQYDPNTETYSRLLLLKKAAQLNIQASTDAAAKAANELLRSMNRGNPVALSEFVKQILSPRGMRAEDFGRYMRNELIIQQLLAMGSTSGQLITPQEARYLYERQNQEFSVQAVVLHATNYPATVAPSTEQLLEFYTNQMARYRIPERVQVSYVKFVASNYVAEATKDFAAVTNLDQMVESQYNQLGSNYFKDAKSPEEAKANLRELMFKGAMFSHARKAANEFASVLIDQEPVRAENLTKLAQTKGLTVDLSEPFTENAPPASLLVGEDFGREAFKLTDMEPIAGPIAGDEAVYVIANAGRLPSVTPPYEQISERVKADYQYYESVMTAYTKGQSLAVSLTNALATGKAFDVACTEAGVSPLPMPPFSLAVREMPAIEQHVNLMQFKQAVATTPVGQVSGFFPTGAGGFLVYVERKLPLDEARMTKEMPGFLASVRQTRQSEAFQHWFRVEADRALRDTPINRQAQQKAAGQPPQ